MFVMVHQWKSGADNQHLMAVAGNSQSSPFNILVSRDFSCLDLYIVMPNMQTSRTHIMIKCIGAALTLVLFIYCESACYLIYKQEKNIYTCIHICNLTPSISTQNQLLTLILCMVVYKHISRRLRVSFNYGSSPSISKTLIFGLQVDMI